MLVIYKLFDKEESPTYARPIDMFNEIVECENETIQRFTYIDPDKFWILRKGNGVNNR